MKHIFNMALILGISFLGELLNHLIPLPIPGSIYGLVLMFVALCTKLIPEESIRTTGTFLIEIMPVMFIPATVALMDSWGVLQGMLVPVLVIMVVSSFAVMGVTGLVTQAAIRRGRKEGKEDA